MSTFAIVGSQRIGFQAGVLKRKKTLDLQQFQGNPDGLLFRAALMTNAGEERKALDMAKDALRRKANVNACTGPRESNEFTDFGNQYLMMCLCDQQGASNLGIPWKVAQEAKKLTRDDVRKLAQAQGIPLTSPSTQETPLMYTAFHDCYKLARLYLRAGADHTLIDKDGNTALITAAKNISLGVGIVTLDHLKRKGIPSAPYVNHLSKDKESALTQLVTYVDSFVQNYASQKKRPNKPHANQNNLLKNWDETEFQKSLAAKVICFTNLLLANGADPTLILQSSLCSLPGVMDINRRQELVSYMQKHHKYPIPNDMPELSEAVEQLSRKFKRLAA